MSLSLSMYIVRIYGCYGVHILENGCVTESLYGNVACHYVYKWY